MGYATLDTYKTLKEAKMAQKKFIKEKKWSESRIFIFNEPHRNKEEPYCLCID